MTDADTVYDEPEESPLLPEDVFTPRQPPSREMFTRRNESDLYGNPGLQDRVRDALRERVDRHDAPAARSARVHDDARPSRSRAGTSYARSTSPGTRPD
jgi:hypothetical protein